jgi:hypothetical protein
LIFIINIPIDLNFYSKYFYSILDSIFNKSSSFKLETKAQLFSQFFYSFSHYINSNSSIMKNILNSQNFLNFIKPISFSNSFSKYSESFKTCFIFFNYKEYFLSKESYETLLKCELIDKSIDFRNVINNDDEIIKLMV